MKYFGFLFVSIVLAMPEVRSANDIDPFIMGGGVVENGEFPSAVFIHLNFDPFEFCGGTIVNNQHVVTAAHCLIRFNFLRPEIIHSQLLQIIAGDRNFLTPSFGRQIRHASNVFVHPLFNKITRENDIAVLRLSEPYELPDNVIESAVRRRRIVPNGQVCVFVGWGYNADGGTFPNFNIAQINITIMLTDVCNGLGMHRGGVRESMICAGVPQPQPPSTIPTGVCHGNEGSGLYCNNELTGILSNGVACGVNNIPGVYTQVRFFNNWLEEQFARNDTHDGPIW